MVPLRGLLVGVVGLWSSVVFFFFFFFSVRGGGKKKRLVIRKIGEVLSVKGKKKRQNLEKFTILPPPSKLSKFKNIFSKKYKV